MLSRMVYLVFLLTWVCLLLRRQTRRSDARYQLRDQSISWCSPLIAADEGPADGQDDDHQQEAGQDDVQDPPL